MAERREGICPYLHVDRETGKYICRAASTEVNPLIYPCLGNFFECPAYARAVREGIPAKPEEKVAEEKPVEKPVEELAPPPPPRPEVPLMESLETPVLGKLTSLEEKLRQADSMWQTYTEQVLKTVTEWLELRREVESRLYRVERLLELYRQKIEECTVRLELGLLRSENVDTEDYMSRLREKLEALTKLKEELETRLQNIDAHLQDHRKRIQLILARPEFTKYRTALTKLEELWREGRVDEKVYKRLKRELSYVLPE